MPRQKVDADALTPLELELMQVLWEATPATVTEVQGRLQRPLAYTTVQTVLNVLCRKGKAVRFKKRRTFYYSPAVSRFQVVTHILNEVVDRVFGGSASSLVMSLVETRHLTPEKLSAVADTLERAEREAQVRKGRSQ